MGNNSRRVIGISALTFLVALVVFLIYSISTFQPKLVLSAFLWRWAWVQSLIFFIEALIPLQCTALLLYYSLIAPGGVRARQADVYEPFYQLVNSVLVTLLVFTLFFAALAEGVRPWLYRQQTVMLDQTNLAHLFYADYRSYQQSGKYPQAAYYLNLYLKINPGDQVAQREIDQARLNAARAEAPPSPQAAQPEAPNTAQYLDENAQGLVKIAQSYLTKGDYSSAHYYATLALNVSPGNRVARRLSAQTMVDLSRITTTPAEREQKYYFALKSKGRSDLEQGNTLDAYYLFQSLSASHPKDPDVTTYLRRATADVTQYAFFKDEIDKAASYPGVRSILFVNQRDASGTEIVLFHKMVTLVSGTYVEGVEAARFSNGGKIIFHLTAPFGKVIDHTLSMDCVGRNKAVSYLPTILSGDFPDTKHYHMLLSPSVGTLEQLGSLGASPSHQGIPSLWSDARLAPRFGYSADPLHIELLRRVMIPFGFLIFSIFAIGFGWSLRFMRKRPSYFVFLLIPLVTYVIYLFESFYLFSGKVLFGFIMIVAGLWPALISLLVVQFVLVTISLVYLAGRSTEQ